MRRSILCFVVLCSAIGPGCAAKKPIQSPGVSYVIDPNCLTAPVRLEHCDMSEPPKCRVIAVDFKAGCEQIVVKGVQP